jgi:thioredoxin 1
MVDFFSPLCGACQAMDGIVDSLSLQFAGRALIGKVNVLEDTTLQRTFAIQWWPTFVFLNGGVETRRVIGVTPRETLAAILDSLLMP